jgi:feruloyl esterase
MAWVETNKAPVVLVAGKPVPQAGGPGGPGGGRFGGPGVPGAPPNYPPYALPNKETVYTRPIYPFPNVAKYKGTGDPNDAANYESVKGPLKVPQVFDSEGYKLLGADNLKFYKAENGQLVEIPKP